MPGVKANYNQARCKKPFERLWISSMEDAAIREGFEKLKPGTQYDALYEAALCRERADWIVGMNATRLFSCLYGQTLAVGRVMTPTLAMVVMRDAQIAAFKPEPFWTVLLKAGDLTVSSRRFSTKNDAEIVLQECQATGEVVIEAVETKEKLEKPPLLYDLTSLQRDANRILGFTAQQTLDHTAVRFAVSRSALQAFSTAARSVIIMPLSRQRRWPEAISMSSPLEKWQFCN